jgi:hypothetical protein
LGLIPLGLPSILEESLKTKGFHQSKRYIPLNASWACPEDYLLLSEILTKFSQSFGKKKASEALFSLVSLSPNSLACGY